METERTIGPLQPPPDHSISVHPSLEYQKDHQFGKGEYCTSPSQIKIKYYDQRHQQTMFQVGDVVWVRTHPLSKADEGFMPKLSPKWKALLKLLLNKPSEHPSHSYLKKIKSLLLSHDHSTCALVREILESVLQTETIYIWTVHTYRLYRRQCAEYTYIYSVRSHLHGYIIRNPTTNTFDPYLLYFKSAST